MQTARAGNFLSENYNQDNFYSGLCINHNKKDISTIWIMQNLKNNKIMKKVLTNYE